MKDFDEALVEKNKTKETKSYVANSDMNTTTPKNQTAAEKYKNPSNDV